MVLLRTSEGGGGFAIWSSREVQDFESMQTD